MKKIIKTVDGRQVIIDLLPNVKSLQMKEIFRNIKRLTSLHWDQFRDDSKLSRSDKKMVLFADGTHIFVKNDAADRLFERISIFWRDLIRYGIRPAVCTHPHESVYKELEGDDEIGFITQKRCECCGGYVSKETIDRYRSEQDRRPNDISPPIYYPRDYISTGGKLHVDIEVGSDFVTRDGRKVSIVEKILDDDTWAFLDSNGNLYTISGGRQRFHPQPGDIMRKWDQNFDK